MNIQPFLRTPFTDMFAAVNNYQSHRQCSMHELRLVDCMEAYGLDMGHDKCRLLIEDFHECVQKGKQIARVDIMTAERERQWKAGERKEHYAADMPADSY